MRAGRSTGLVLGALIAVTACGGRVGDDVQNVGGQTRGDAESMQDVDLGGAGREGSDGGFMAESDGSAPGGEPTATPEFDAGPLPDGVPFPPTNANNPDPAACECSPGGRVEIQDGALSLTLDTGTANFYCTDAPWLTYTMCLEREYFQLAACGRDASGFACMEISIGKTGDALTEFSGSYWDPSGVWEVTGGMGIVTSFDLMNGTEASLELALLLVRGEVDRTIHLWVNACIEYVGICSF